MNPGKTCHTIEEAFEWLDREGMSLFKDHKDLDQRRKRPSKFTIIKTAWWGPETENHWLPKTGFKGGWCISFETNLPWKGRILGNELAPIGMFLLYQGTNSSHRYVQNKTTGGYRSISYDRTYNYTVLLPVAWWPVIYMREKLLGRVGD